MSKAQEIQDRLTGKKTATAERPRAVRGGYTVAAGARKPKAPTTGAGVQSRAVSTRVAAPRTLLEVCYEAARDKGVDLAKMKELLAMAREQELSQQEAVFNEALRAAKADLKPIVADSWNAHTKSKWAKYEKVSREVDPVIRAHGFALSFGMANSPIPDHYRVTCDVSHSGGFLKQYFLDGPSDASGPKGGGSKTPVQGVGSTITYLRRILKCLIFDVVVGGEDADGNRQQASITDEQAQELNVAMTEAKADFVKFCEHFGIDKLSDLPASRFKQAMDMVNDKIARAQQQ